MLHLSPRYIWPSVLIAWLCACCIAQAATPAVELTVTDTTLPLQFSAQGLPALVHPTYDAVPFQTATRFTLTPGTAADPFSAPVLGSNWQYESIEHCQFDCQPLWGPRFVFAELLPGDAPKGSTIFVGQFQFHNTPNLDDVECEATLTDAPAQCVVNFGFDFSPGVSTYWVAIRQPGDQPVTFRRALFQPDEATTITGPGHAAAGASVPLRVTPAFPTFFPPAPASRYYSVVDIFDAGTQYLVPLVINAGPLRVDAPVSPLFLDTSYRLDIRATWQQVIPAKKALTHLFIDIPPTADGVPIAAGVRYQVNGGDASQLDVALVRADFPIAARDATIAAAPIDAVPIHVATTWVSAPLSAGRWFLRVRNDADTPALVTLYLGNLGTTSTVATPTIAPGFYYDPQRSGHGLALSRAGTQQVLDWFTYLEDGTPAWYQAQNAAPVDSGWWQATLYRVAWDGAKASTTAVGSVTLTPVATNEFMFTWQLEGQTGSERFSALARTGACPQFDGAATNFTGAWYAPTQSGYGMDVLSLPEQQFAAFYFYDDLGLARWGVGGSVPFASSSTLTLTQNTGFCPSCVYTPVTMQSLGTVDVRYDSASGGNFSSNLVLKAPLSGSWNVSNPMSRLTGSAVCE